MKNIWIRRNDIPRVLEISRQALIRAERANSIRYDKRGDIYGLRGQRLELVPLLTYRAAAKLLGLPSGALAEASKKGFFLRRTRYVDYGKGLRVINLPYISLEEAKLYATTQRVIAEVDRP